MVLVLELFECIKWIKGIKHILVPINLISFIILDPFDALLPANILDLQRHTFHKQILHTTNFKTDDIILT
jgi:hypothetical protein